MQVRIQVKNILNALIQLDKKNEKFYKKNYFLFVNRISRIDYQIKTMMKKHKRNYFIVFNPTWGYFARRYNLKQLDIVANPLDSSDQNVMDIINKIRRLSSNILFIPKYYFPKRLYKQLSEKTKIILAPVSYLDYDWENNLLNISRMIEHQKN
jgi:zinc transport system substrate-binding protein